MVEPTQSYETCLEAAAAAMAAGDKPAAEKALRAAVRAIEGRDGAQLELSSTLIRLGTLKQEMGAFAEAEETFRRALNIAERALGADDLGLVPALTGLGASRILRGAADEAQPVISRAISISETQLGADHPDLVILLNDLTRLYLKQSAYTYAEPLLLRLLAVKRSKGEDHPEVATVLAGLAAVHQALGRHEQAEQLWRRVLTIRERTLAPNHIAIATAYERLAETCSARGKVREALQLFQRALGIRELTLGADHASLRASRERIADLQLQAEDAIETDDAPITVSGRYRLPSGQPLGMSVSVSAPSVSVAAPSVSVSAPVDRKAVAQISEAPAPQPRKAPAQPRPASPPPQRAAARTAPPVIETVEDFAPPAGAFEPAMSAADAQSKAVPYLNTLLAIQGELDEDAPPATASFSERAAAMTATAAMFLRHHRAAAIIGVSAVTLPLVAFAMRSSRAGSGWVEQAVAEAPRHDSIVVTATPELAVRPQGAALDPAKDAVASKAAAARPTDGTSDKKAVDQTPVFPTFAAPTVSQPSAGRLDSLVRATTAPMRVVVESLPAQLGLGRDATGTRPASGGSFFEAVGTSLRARLMGELPTPRYPAQLLAGGVGGEVRVRFDVDTTGRPLMSTFAVVSSPHSLLTSAVKKVIPQMRFEPARSAAPESRNIVDRIEMAFQFAPPSRD